jgi:anaerobic selenocysteine-containing dehydrogenase
MHLVTGKIGRPGAGPLQMAGQPSAMSNRETGACGSYPGYRNFHNAKHMRDLCDLWEIPYETFHAEPPVDVLTVVDRMHRGQVPFLWIIGTNPLVSLPDQVKVREALERAFVVVQDPFVDAETVAHADLYLPAAMWGEKSGCMTNADRSVNLLEKAVEPPGEARSDFDVFVDVARRLGLVTKEGRPLLDFDGPEAAFEEWKKVSKDRPCDYSGMTWAMLKERGAVRWPCNEEHPDGAERLYEDRRFWTSIDDCQSYGNDFKTGAPVTRQEYERIDPHGRAWLKPCEWQPPSNAPHEGRPFLLSTGRLVWHWHTRTKTRRAPALESRAPRAYVEVHPDDAAPRGIATGTLVGVESDFGRWEGPALVGDVVRPGMLFVPFHYGESPVNRATSPARDPVSAQPHFKHVAASLTKLADAAPEPWLLERSRDLAAGGVPYAARATGGTVHLPAPG